MVLRESEYCLAIVEFAQWCISSFSFCFASWLATSGWCTATHAYVLIHTAFLLFSAWVPHFCRTAQLNALELCLLYDALRKRAVGPFFFSACVVSLAGPVRTPVLNPKRSGLVSAMHFYGKTFSYIPYIV